MATENSDPKPSGAAFQAPLDLSYEAGVILSTLVGAVYASLHPVSVVLAGVALGLIGLCSAWLPIPSDIGNEIGDEIGVEIPAEQVALVSENAPLNELPSLPSSFAVAASGTNPMVVAAELMQPWVELVGDRFWFQALLCLWSLVVWSWVGTMICRRTALRLGQVDHQWIDVVRFTHRHFLDSLFSILIPLAAVAALALPLVVMGFFLAWEWTSVIAAPFLLVGAGLGLLMGVVLLGLILSWPLMFPAIAFEGRDSFESISRAYAYILQRPVHAFVVAGAAILIGSITGYVIELFCVLSAGGYTWSLSWGANAFDGEHLERLLAKPTGGTAVAIEYWTSPLLQVGRSGILFLGRAAGYSMFWGLASGAYLLLRRYLDQTPLDEIHRPGVGMLQPLDVSAR